MHRRRRKIALLFFPETPQGMVALIAAALLIVSALIPNVILALLGTLALLGAWMVAIISLRRRNRRLKVLRALAIPIKVIFLYVAFTALFSGATWALAWLVTQGDPAHGHGSVIPNNTAYFAAESLVALTVIQTVIFIPFRLHKMKIDVHDDKVRNAMLGLTTVVASTLTGCYIVMLHFDGGTLSSLPRGELGAGAIFAIALIAPVYRSFSKSCWEHGYRDLFSPLKARRRWAHALSELEDALNRAAPPAPP
jgi:hypothetical protein